MLDFPEDRQRFKPLGMRLQRRQTVEGREFGMGLAEMPQHAGDRYVGVADAVAMIEHPFGDIVPARTKSACPPSAPR